MSAVELDQDEINALSPGIRGAVLWLRKNGFETTDSGDGSNYGQGMECAVPYPMIAIVVSKADLLDEADRLAELLSKEGLPLQWTNTKGKTQPEDAVQVQATYDAGDNSCLIIVSEFGEKGYLARLGA